MNPSSEGAESQEEAGVRPPSSRTPYTISSCPAAVSCPESLVSRNVKMRSRRKVGFYGSVSIWVGAEAGSAFIGSPELPAIPLREPPERVTVSFHEL